LDLSKIGVLALGSHEERHGAALPPDTDAKIASYVALESARRTGVKFLGVVYSSYELPGIDTGHHHTLEELLEELRTILRQAKNALGVTAVVLVNGHGGNTPLRERLPEIEAELGMRLVFNNTIIDLEGPHAATEELSMGAAVGIADESKVTEHTDFSRYPEVGFVGLREARKRYEWAERQAREVEAEGVRVDRELGRELLERAIVDAINDVKKLKTEEIL
jgi:2-amino-5-formylamino-6-ribosylaminopyrimidin-4(3H)-one 5'-monophosphate deformylase